MIAFAFYLLKVVFCSCILFLYYWLFLRNRIFHQWNRFYLLFAVVLSLVLPLIQFTLFFADEGRNDALLFLQKMQSPNDYLDEIVITTNSQVATDIWFWTGYSFVSVLLLSFFLLSLIKIISLIRQHSFEIAGKVRFADSTLPGTPFSFFHYIFWNKEILLESEAGQQIFQHELVHVKEKHTLDKLFLQFILGFFWFNPFFWLIRRELLSIHEFIADKKSIAGSDATAFAAIILQTVYPQQFASLVHPFFQSPIKRRVTMLTKNQRVNYVSRIIALPVVAIIAFAITMRTNASGQKEFTGQISPVVSTVANTDPGKENYVNDIDVDKSNSTAMPAQATSKALAKENPEKARPIRVKSGKDTLPAKPSGPKPLYFVDGKEFSGDLNTIDPQRIESMNVLKDKSAIDKYGERGKNGVVEITLKKSGQVNENNIVFEQTEIPASIDKQEWRTFLEKNVQPIIVNAASKGAKPGTYTVNIRFLVKSDGSLSEFTALNNPGYDLGKQVVALMPSSPKWKPAQQNGKPVSSYHTQPITLVIQAQ
ncbi:M56 family metallopeptidase [Flavisolibacter nicotianae]|uniref:M56 family metallopeptidase n=1 Tax=Flavisolibacter nicotianae TaxID=2364882 RepID=UPI000EAEC809|nr:M56 family metallopeptidase [Flavisolibacter nicotianae]